MCKNIKNTWILVSVLLLSSCATKKNTVTNQPVIPRSEFEKYNASCELKGKISSRLCELLQEKTRVLNPTNQENRIQVYVYWNQSFTWAEIQKILDDQLAEIELVDQDSYVVQAKVLRDKIQSLAQWSQIKRVELPDRAIHRR